MTTFHELNEQGAYHPWETAVRALGSSGVELIGMKKAPGDYADPPTERLLVVQCRSDNVRYAIDIGDGTFSGRAHADDLIVVPPCVKTSFRIYDDHEFRIVALPQDLLEAPQHVGHSDLIERLAPLRRRRFRNALISQVINRLWEIGDADDRTSAYGEAAAMIIGAEIVQEAGQTVPPAVGGLSPRQIAQACGFMTANMARRISTAEVAEAIGMSPYHFTRQFGRSLACSPQKWLTRHRIEVAKTLLQREARMPISEVAAQVGYQNQSAFGCAFERHTGLTPARFRKANV